MTYVIVDLEATCCNKGTVPRNQMEIIEIGAIALDANGLQIVDEFQAFIKPVIHPQLTAFCTELTSITQEELSDARGYTEILPRFKKWFWSFDQPIFCSWGDYDKKQFQQDCAYHQVPYPFDHQHINIKKRFAKNCNKKPMPLGLALQHMGLSFEGRAHRGIDDVRNMARLAQWIFFN